MLINFPYIKRDTPVHRLDPRTKLIMLFAFVFAITQSSNFWFVLVGLILTSIYYSQAHLSWAETKLAWIVIITLSLFIFLFNYLIGGGQIVLGVDVPRYHQLFQVPFPGFQTHFPYLGPSHLTFTIESIIFLLTQFIRSISIALLVLPIPYTIDPAHFGVAFRRMGVSDNVSYAIDLSIRFLPSTGRDFLTTLDAQRARGFEVERLRGGIFGKIARLAPMVIPVVIGSVVGAEDIINAMELRCFGIGRRSWLVELHARQVDRLLITSSIVGLILVTIWNISGNFSSQPLIHFLHVQGIAWLLP